MKKHISTPNETPMRKLTMATLRMMSTLVLWTLVNSSVAQTPPTVPPGVPEPGLVIWGTVVNKQNTSQTLAISSVNWVVTDGTKSATFSATSKPQTQIINKNGQFYYVLEVPFDTRTFGTITLNDPAVEGINSFELKSANPPTYTMTATINGALASVRSIDGAPSQSGANFPVTGFTSVVRGRIYRVDLSIDPPRDPYEDWVFTHFGSPDHPNGGRTLDPDGDGMTNEQEYLAGTDPNERDSALQILTFTAGAQVTIGWQSIANKNYKLQSASSVNGPWNDATASIPASAEQTQASIQKVPADSKKFYRVTIAP